MVIWSNAWCKLVTIVKSNLYCSDLVDVSSCCWQKNCKEKTFAKLVNCMLHSVMWHAAPWVVWKCASSPDSGKRIQSPKLLLIWKRDNSERAPWCQTVCFIKSTAWPHALNHLLLSLKSAHHKQASLITKSSRGPFKVDAVS